MALYLLDDSDVRELKDLLSRVRNMRGDGVRNAPGGITIGAVGGDLAGVTSEESKLSYPAIVTGHAAMSVPNTNVPGAVIDHPYRFKYAFSEADLTTNCLDATGAVMTDGCTLAAADNVTHAALSGGRSGTTAEGWAVNLTEMTHILDPGDSNEWWIWGRDINALFYPKLYGAVAPGSDDDGVHVLDFAVQMFEYTDTNGFAVRYFSYEGRHIGNC